MTFKQDFKIGVRTLLVSGLVFSMLLATLLSCQAPESIPTTPPSSPLPPSPAMPKPADVWSADGIITVREYAGNMREGKYLISWWSDTQYVYIGIKVETNGWVAVGIQPASKMKNADMIFGFVKDGYVEVYDLFSTGDFGPHPPDTEFGGTDDILEFGGSEEGGFTIIEFKRALDTGDEYDNTLTQGVNKIIWAYGSSDILEVKHSTRGYGEINLGL